MNHVPFGVMSEVAADSRLLVPLRAEGELQPVFCIHHSGGDVGIYRKVVSRMATGRPVFGIQSRLETGEDQEFSSLETMADAYAELIAMQSCSTRTWAGPVHLLGFSFGGFVATLVAERLHRIGVPVGFLGLIDSNPGWTEGQATTRNELTLRLMQLFHKFHSVGIMDTKPDSQMRQDIGKLVDLCLQSDQLHPSEIVQTSISMGYVPKTESYTEMLGQFAYRFVCHCRMLLGFRASDVLTPMHLWWPSEGQHTPDGRRRWASVAGAGLEQHSIEGSHYSIMRMPAAKEIAAQIDRAIQRVEADQEWADLPSRIRSRSESTANSR